MWIEYEIWDIDGSSFGCVNINNVARISLYLNGVWVVLTKDDDVSFEFNGKSQALAVYDAFKDAICGESKDIDGIGFVRPLHRQPVHNYSLCQLT